MLRGEGEHAVPAEQNRRFQELVLRHLDAAYNLARWLARNDDDAKDIAQEAYLRAFRFFGGFHGDDARAWLLAIVRNTYYTWRTTHRSRTHDESFEEETHGLGESSTILDGASNGNPEVLLMQQASKRIINTALERLPLESREMIVLRELEDLSYKEIATIVEVPIGTVMSRLARARGLLRAALQQMNAESQM
jgi:RNA polymerase sigma-70 factor (ECF subfamily)